MISENNNLPSSVSSTMTTTTNGKYRPIGNEDNNEGNQHGEIQEHERNNDVDDGDREREREEKYHRNDDDDDDEYRRKRRHYDRSDDDDDDDERRRRRRSRKRDRSRDRVDNYSSSGNESSDSSSRRRGRKRRSGSRVESTVDDVEEERRKREEEEEARMKCTVFVCNLALSVDERMLFEFFQQRVGPVVDTRIIRDRHSGRSKGFAFVQFTEESAVGRAIQCSNTPLEGRAILVRQSESDRSTSSDTPSHHGSADDDITRLFFRPVPDALQIDDFKLLFSVVGPVLDIEIAADEHGKSKNYGYVTYENGSDAKRALVKFNNLNLGLGYVLRMGMWNEEKAVMFDQQTPAMGMSPHATWSMLPQQTQQQYSGVSAIPTQNILLTNMFDPKEEEDPNFDEDIREDVLAESEERFGRALHVFVDKNSAGNVYMRLEDIASAQRAQQTLNLRWFGGRQVTAMFVTDESYLNKFPELTAPTSSQSPAPPTQPLPTTTDPQQE